MNNPDKSFSKNNPRLGFSEKIPDICPMTASDLAILLDEKVCREIERFIDSDPTRAALSAASHGSQIATQVKYLQRARTKLPSYYQARCILPPLAFEQASSEETAALKTFNGNLCVDLTCGLGVDAFYLSHRFKRVITLERDPLLAEIARINFRRLGATNIEVHNLAAEEFLQDSTPYLSTSSEIDLIYVDPARRGERGEKLFRLESCSPNVIQLLPSMRALTHRIVIKASPLFDAEEAFRLFGPASTVEIVSLHDECKEVLLMPADDATRPGEGWIRTTAAGKGTLSFRRETVGSGHKARYLLSIPTEKELSQDDPSPSEDRSQEQPETTPTGSTLMDTPSNPVINFRPNLPEAIFTTSPRYLLIPDVSLYHAHLIESYAQALGIDHTSPTGYCFAHQLPSEFLGKAYPIRHILPYQPKKLKSWFKTEGITRCNLLKKDFPWTSAQIASALGIREGGTHYAAFTRFNKEPYAIILDHD